MLPRESISFVRLSLGHKRFNMNKLIILIGSIGLIAIGLFLAGCGSASTSENTVTNANSVADHESKAFKLEFKSQPTEIQAGTPTELTFTVKDGKGATVKDLQIVHEKPMHLLIVSSDLAEFYHIHPEVQTDGSYRVSETFPNGGDYRLYADFTPIDQAQVVEQIDVKVAGPQRARVALVADQKFEKTVDGLRVVMKPSVPIKAGEELTLDFEAFDAASGKPATDLQKYLGELAHFVLISEDLKDFVHAHPMSKGQKMDSMNMGSENGEDHNTPHDHSKMESSPKVSSSEVSAHTAFPRPGLYKIWAQFQRGGKVIVVPFIVDAPAADQAKTTQNISVPSDAVKVTVSKNGFEPAEIKGENGKPVMLAFYRADSENCASEVVFSKLNITRKLPVGEVVLVEFTPKEAGDISFACGMNMLKGKVVVN